MSDEEMKSRDDIFSKIVRAGKRTYFFDVKSTRKGEYYLTITESKKKILHDGRFQFEKHKLFLYKEDFEKFVDNMNETLEYIKTHNTEFLEEVESEVPEKDQDGLDALEKENF